MALLRASEAKTGVLFVGLALVMISAGRAEGARRALAASNGATVFDITKYGAREGGKVDCAMAFIRAWNAACRSSAPAATVVIPPGKFMAGEVILEGPCGSSPITIDVQGTLLGNTDISEFANGQWIQVYKVDRLVMTGSGTFHGQGESVWNLDACGGKAVCNSRLPPSVVFEHVNNSIVEKISWVNSKGFNIKINNGLNFTVQNINITAPENSPNTDGIHISGSGNVTIKDSTIGTGDDCISIGEGSTNIHVSGITCGPGHGISIGSLGLRKDEEDVSGILVENCTLSNTTNGARIKTWHNSPPLKATGIVFQNIVMKDVRNPIYIDQHYGSKKKLGSSNVKISDVHFNNIKGTTTSNTAVALLCSNTSPCEGIELVDIDFALSANLKNQTLVSQCAFVKPTFSGKQNPNPCPA